MTSEQAIKTLKNAAFLAASNSYQDIEEAANIAFNALKKQIPQKPNMFSTDYNDNLWRLHCPSCGNWIGMYNSRLKRGYMHNISNWNICPYCGRVIDCAGVE